MQGADLGGLIGDIYDAALVDELWPSIMTRIGRAFDCHVGAVMFVHNAKGGCQRILGSPDRQDSIQDYLKNWSHLDGLNASRDASTGRDRPRRRSPDIAHATAALRQGEVCTDTMIAERAELIRTEFFARHLSRFDYDYALGAKVWDGPEGAGLFSMSRPERRGPFGTSDIALFGAIQPHLRRALAISERCAWTRAGGWSDESGPRDWTSAVLVLDHLGRSGYLNPAAQALLERGDGIRMSRGHLRADNLTTDTQLAAAIKLSVDGNADGRRIGGAVSIPRSTRTTPLSLLVAPVGLAFDWFLPQRPRAVVTIIDPEQRSAPTRDHLRALFRLTESEAAVAIGVSQGHGLKSIAMELNLTHDTARQYLTRAYAKTGTRRQNDLTRLLAEIGAAS